MKGRHNKKSVRVEFVMSEAEAELVKERMDFNAAIFDLDGTILDSMDVWEHIDIQFLRSS